MNKLGTILLSVVLFMTVGLVWAHESGTNVADEVKNKVLDRREEVRTEIKTRKDKIRTEVREKKENARSEVSEKREELREKNLQGREDLKRQVEQRKEEIMARVEEKRGELKTRIEQKREELKQRLEKIRDEKKKEVVERIDKRMDELNKRLLDHYLNVLEKLGNVLVKISERANRAEERGVDIAAVRTVMDAANSAFATARSAVETQSGKTYTIQISTEEGLKTDVGRARQALHNDLAVVRLAVKAAHEAVRNAATTLAQLPRPTSTPEETGGSTPTPTPSR